MVVIAVLAAMMVSSFLTNEKWNFPFAFEIMQQSPVIEGLWKGTIFGTVGAMILGIGLGVLLAVMRLSTNPVLRGVAFVYTWFFRAIPRYVLLVLLGTGIGFLLPRLRHRGAVRATARQPAGPREQPHVLHARLQQHLEHHLGRHPGPGPVGGRLHGRDRPRRHPVGRQGPGRGRPGARHAARQDHAAGRAPPGDARHRPADGQRDDRHGQGHLAPRGGALIVELFYQSSSSVSAASRSCPASSPRRSGTSSSARSSWSASPAWSATTAAGSGRCPRRRSRAHRDRGGPLMAHESGTAPRRSRAPRARRQRHQGVPRQRGAQGHRHGCQRGEVVVPARPVRVGQVDLPAVHQPARDDRRRPHLGRRRPHGLRGPRRHAAPTSPTSEIAAQRREIGMCFQRFNLFPHKTALENVVEAPIQVKGASRRRDTGRRAARTGRAWATSLGLPVAALRWAAATGRDRARPGNGPR